MLLSDNRTPEYKNLSYEQRREFNKRIVVSKEDLYSNQLLYGKIIDFIIKNKIITISSDREPYKIEALVDNWFKEVNCVDQCLLGNNRNIFEVMKQLGITRIVNVKNYPLKEL